MTTSTPRLLGHGPVRVMAFHGWFGSSRGWGSLPEFVDTEKFTFAWLDYRGYGERRDVTGQYSVAEISADALRAADALGWERFHVLGHSMGGLAVQHVLKDAPTRVERVAALSGVPATGAQFDEPTYAMFEAAVGDDAVRMQLAHFGTGFRLSDAAAGRIVADSREFATEVGMDGNLPSWVRTDISADVRGMPNPVLVMVGEHDPSMTAAVMEATWLQCYPNAHLEVLPNAGHYAMYETPAWLATCLERFYLAVG